MNAATHPHSAHWLLLAVLGAFLWLAASQLHDPLAWDEVNFYWNAQAIAETGVPYANAGFLGDRGAIGERNQYGLWHPPLYLYTLGLAFKLFGASEAVARGTGVVVMLLTAIVVYLLGRQVIPPPAREWGALLAVALFLASPLVVQSALVLDIDGTVLTLVLACWSLLYLRLENVAPRRQPFALGLLAVLFALALWAKLTTPFFLLGVVVVYQTLRWRPLQAVTHLLIIGVGGVALFLNTWGLACDQLGMPFEMPFEVTWAELHDAAAGESTLEQRIEGQALPILAWVSPYLAALFAGAVVARVVSLLRRRRLEPVDFLLGMGILVGAIYVVKLAAGFPKYHVAMLPFWTVVIAYWAATSWASLPRPIRYPGVLLAAAAVGLAIGYALAFIGDYWMLVPQAMEQPVGVGLGLVAAEALVLAALLQRAGIVAPLVALALALYGGWAVSADWYQAQAPYSTNYWYGTRGQREIAAVVQRLLTKYGIEGPYVGAKEVVFYTDHHFFLDQDTVQWLWEQTEGTFDGRLLGYDIPLVAAWVRDPWVRHIFSERLAPQYEPVAEWHDYLVFLRRSLSAPTIALDEPADDAEPAAPDVARSVGGEDLAVGTEAVPPLTRLAPSAAPSAPASARADRLRGVDEE